MEFLVIDIIDVNLFVIIVEIDIVVIVFGGCVIVNVRLEEYEFFLDVSIYFIVYWLVGIIDEEICIFNICNGFVIYFVELIDIIVIYIIYDDELEVDCYYCKNYYMGLDLVDVENIEFEIF